MTSTQSEVDALRSSFDPFTHEMVETPYATLAHARSIAPLFWSDVLDAWVVTGHALMEEIHRDPKRFPSGGLGVMTQPPAEVQEILSAIEFVSPLRATDPPDHTRQRRPTLAAVAPRRVAALEPMIRRIADELIDDFIERGSCDFRASFAYPFPLRVISGLLGFSDDVADRIHRWAACRVSLAWGKMELEEWKDAARGMVEFYEFIRAEVVDRQENPRDDGLSDFVQNALGAAEPMTVAEIVEQTMGLVTGGHETTANWLTLSMHHLLTERARWEDYCNRDITTSELVEETLRFDSPVRAVWRKAGEDLEFGGENLKAGERIYCVNAAANRDPEVFEDAAGFCPGRQNARLHFTFGRATHHCIGAGLSRREGAAAFEALAARLPSVQLASNELTCVPNATLRITEKLMITWDTSDTAPASTN
ncbi:cytochrome P450 [Rhodococcus sp. 27YEA15]|uniref:cytochrome P450 n=1 Tax=Rhodococcus sp. 27YEA15 TaxID=3156259 RepID=UPI003C7D0312